MDNKYNNFYQVILIQDDITPSSFVLMILNKIFKLDEQNAEFIIRYLNKQGKAVVYTGALKIAESLIEKVHLEAISNDYILSCELQKENRNVT